MKSRRYFTATVVKGICITAIILMAVWLNSFAQQGGNQSESQIQKGFAIAPVPLNLQGKNRALVGMGSYLVNAGGGCNDCHTNPPFVDNPFAGAPGVVNSARYLAGGTPFGPPGAPTTPVSRNLTPDVLGRPAGLSFSDFRQIIRTGVDDDGVPPHPATGTDYLQVMPWPIYRNLSDNDLSAIYEYLSSIPCIATPAGANGEPPAHSCT